jgi:predicted dehydrogenase
MTNGGKIGVALLSMAHAHARGYADQVRDHPDCQTIAIWDDDASRGQPEAERRGLPFYTHIEEVLALPDVDAVVCSAPTDQHRDLLVAAANAGKHIFTEKSLTVTVSEAVDVLRAVEDAKIKFMISLPSRTRPEILMAKKIVEDGLLGDVTEMRARIAHSAALDRWFSGGSLWFGDEAAAGGGAFFDLGCHQVDIMRWILGEPACCVARMVNFSEAYNIDDSMAAIVEFRNKALGILDVSWVHRSGPNPVEIYGTEGFLGIGMMEGGPRIQLHSRKVSAGDLQGWITPTNLPKALPSPMQQWISAIKDGTTPTITVYDGWNLVQLLEGCYQAAREGHEVTF